MDEVTHTIMPQGGWGGTALGAGVGGLLGSWLGNGGFGGLGYRGAGAAVGYDMESPAGVKRVIEMEYRELMNAATPAETEENIYHLSVALLRYWRLRHEHANAHGSGDKSGATK